MQFHFIKIKIKILCSSSSSSTCSKLVKMGLVDYGSDSDSNSTQPTIAVAHSKKSKGPVRILLDLPPPSSSSSSLVHSDEPPSKKPRFSLGNGPSVGGLASMLPRPKNASLAVKLEKALGAGGSGRTGVSLVSNDQGDSSATTSSLTGFVPYSLGKGKKAALPPPVDPEDPGLDFFGLGKLLSHYFQLDCSHHDSIINQGPLSAQHLPTLPLPSPSFHLHPPFPPLHPSPPPPQFH